jgi:hypothetical protein
LRRFARENGLSLFFAATLLGALAGQSFAGLHQYNAEALEHGEATVAWARYVTGSEFGGDVLENWQSEFLQFWLYIVATVWLLQRGSSESKQLGDEGLMSDEDEQVGRYATARSPAWAKAGGVRRVLYENSLAGAMLLCFLGSWIGQSVTDWRAYNHELLAHDAPPISWTEYWGNADFWNRSLQNWQSEFLAVGTMAVFAIYLRQRGSAESKPVGAAHTDTGRTN